MLLSIFGDFPTQTSHLIFFFLDGVNFLSELKSTKTRLNRYSIRIVALLYHGNT